MRALLPAAAGVACLLQLLACTIPAPVSVGSVAVSWHEENDEPVGKEVLDSGATLLRDQGAWDEWVDALPVDMRQAREGELQAVSLDGSVAVVAVWDRCVETSHITHAGDDTLQFTVTTDRPDTECEWSPRRVEVWDILLADLNVSRDKVILKT